MNFALIIYRHNDEFLWSVEEYETCSEVEQRISDLEQDKNYDFTYRVYSNPLTVKISPPMKSTVNIF